MSDEIYVNIGTSFQQPYQGQGLAQGRTPVIAQYIARQPANAQTPFTYQNRQPANARQPSSAQTPYIANRQIPSIVQATANYPYIASAQQPYPYIANAQTTIQVTGRSPVIYGATGRTPFTYARQGQTPYNATGRLPYTYEHQGRSPYSFQQSFQQPYARQAQQPYTFNDTGGTPFTYERQGQSPYSYQQSYQHPTIYTHQVSTNYQVIYRHPQTYTHQVSVSYRHPSIAQTTYRHPVIAQTSYQHPVIAQQPASIVGRQPTPYTYPDPIQWGPYSVTSGSSPSGYTVTFSRYGYSTSSPFAPYGYDPVGYSLTWPQTPAPPLTPYGTGEWIVKRDPGGASTAVLRIGELSFNPSGFSGMYDINNTAVANYFVLNLLHGTTTITTTLPLASGTAETNPYGNHYYNWTIPAVNIPNYVSSSYQPMSIALY